MKITWILVATLLENLTFVPSASAKLRKTGHGHQAKRNLLHDAAPLLPKSIENGVLSKPVKVNKPDDSRIVGGEPVSGPEIYPFFVSWDGSCGGSLIHSDIVLTAAHCSSIFSNTVTIDAYRLEDSSTPGAVTKQIVEKVSHPNYNSFTFANDFLLLKLDSPVTTVESIPLNYDSSVPTTGQNLTVIGLGTTSEGGFQSNVLREVSVEAVADDVCNENYDGEIVEDVMICAGVAGGGKDSCQGDSGGPIFTITESGDIGVQVGVVSWGAGCARPDLPGVYAEISAASDWIFSETCRLSSDKPDSCPEPTPSPTPSPPAEDEAQVDVLVYTDNYPFEVSWSLLDDTGRVVASVAPGTYTTNNQLFTQTMNLKLGVQHTFIIEDSAGDGLCCGYGEGMWSVRTNDVLLANGARYGASDSATFVIPQEDPTESPTPSPTPAESGATTSAPTPAPSEETSSPTSIPVVPIDCEDSSDMIYVDVAAGSQTCGWLGTNLDRYGYLCQFVDVAIVCPETCDWCDLFG